MIKLNQKIWRKKKLENRTLFFLIVVSSADCTIYQHLASLPAPTTSNKKKKTKRCHFVLSSIFFFFYIIPKTHLIFNFSSFRFFFFLVLLLDDETRANSDAQNEQITYKIACYFHHFAYNLWVVHTNFRIENNVVSTEKQKKKKK